MNFDFTNEMDWTLNDPWCNSYHALLPSKFDLRPWISGKRWIDTNNIVTNSQQHCYLVFYSLVSFKYKNFRNQPFFCIHTIHLRLLIWLRRKINSRVLKWQSDKDLRGEAEKKKEIDKHRNKDHLRVINNPGSDRGSAVQTCQPT